MMNALSFDASNPYAISELEMHDLIRQLESQSSYQKAQQFHLTGEQRTEMAKFLADVDKEEINYRDAVRKAAVSRMTWKIEGELRQKLVPEISKKLIDEIEEVLREKLKLIDQIDLSVLRTLVESTKVLTKTLQK